MALFKSSISPVMALFIRHKHAIECTVWVRSMASVWKMVARFWASQQAGVGIIYKLMPILSQRLRWFGFSSWLVMEVPRDYQRAIDGTVFAPSSIGD
jgi:hypothetical protein